MMLRFYKMTLPLFTLETLLSSQTASGQLLASVAKKEEEKTHEKVYKTTEKAKLGKTKNQKILKIQK